MAQTGVAYEPLPRWGHAIVSVGDRVYMWGGRTEGFSVSTRKSLASCVEVFDLNTELWEKKTTSGTPPLGLYNNAHALIGSSLYVYGGYDGQKSYNTLYKLDLSTLQWTEVKYSSGSKTPMKMSGCGMVAYGTQKLVLFGGYGVTEDQDRSSPFFKRNSVTKGTGWTSEVWVFDIEEGKWFEPEASGSCPPPCVDFSFTKVDGHRAIVFGGHQPETGAVSDAYILELGSWVWKKLVKGSGDAAWPIARDGHAATVLHCRGGGGGGGGGPQLLLMGGWDVNDSALDDVWLLDIEEAAWVELPKQECVGSRFWHAITSVGSSATILAQVLCFGGCPIVPSSSGESWPKLSGTILLELGNFGSNSWSVIDAVDQKSLGRPLQRMKEKVVMAEYRATVAEKVALEVKERASSGEFVKVPAEKETEAKEEADGTPAWMIPKDEVQVTSKELGRGRWGYVRVANYRGAQVAAKCYYEGSVDAEDRMSFLQCLEVASKLKHPNLAVFVGVTLGDNPILLKELVQYNLKSVLDTGSLPYHQFTSIAVDVASALKYLHELTPLPIIHGDLKNTNVLLEPIRGGKKWRAKLSNYMTASFFLSRVPLTPLPGSASPARPRLSQTKGASIDALSFGTSFDSVGSTSHKLLLGQSFESSSPVPMSPTYQASKKMSFASPEPYNPLEPSPKRDTYSFGMLLIELVTRSSPVEVALAYLLESITWPDIAALVKDCIDMNAIKRPNMTEIIAKLTGTDK